jgi:hypothetical protein
VKKVKKILFVTLVLCVAAGAAYAQGNPISQGKPAAVVAQAQVEPVVPTAETVTLKGDVIDNTCAAANVDTLATFVTTHTKQCALSCAQSGYAIFADGKLYAFDKDSSAKVAEFLKKEDSKLQVVVTATKIQEVLSLVSIENQL